MIVEDLFPRGFWPRAAFVAVYAALWILGDIASLGVAGGTGLGVWLVDAALDVLLFLVLGWRWFPLPVVLLAISYWIVPADRYGSFWDNVLGQLPYELILALATKMTVETFCVRFPLRSARDVTVFAVGLSLVGAGIANAAFVAVFTIVDPTLQPWSAFPDQFLRGLIADTTAIIVLVPVITQFMAWRKPLVPGASEPKVGQAFIVGLIVTSLVVVAEYVLGARVGHSLGELSLVPLAWLSITFGMRGAVLGLLVADVTASLMHVSLQLAIASQIEYQWYLIASALLALLMGAIATDRRELVARLQHAAYFDSLTDLPNTGRLLAWLREVAEKEVLLAMIDIADMRMLNEGVGREAADKVLVEASIRLRNGFASDSFVARVGSGEFAVATAKPLEAQELVLAIQRLFEPPFSVAGAHVFVDAAIGVLCGDASEPHELLRQADLATRHAKSAPSQTAVYSRGESASTGQLLVVELHRAAEGGEFVPFYQPIFRHRDGVWSLEGAEVLMRWRHPERGLLAPAEFMHLLERLTICNRVGYQMLEESLRQAMTWRATLAEFRAWVNFFPRQVFDPRFMDRLHGVIEKANAVPEALVVEVTETVVASSEVNIAGIVEKLASAGIRVAIDDFGTGGSSLGRVRQVPAQIIKIDRSFVTRSDVDPKAMSVAKTVVRLGAELGMTVLAEGIESTPQLEAMLAIGCELGQGYAMGHPVPAALFERLLTQSLAS